MSLSSGPTTFRQLFQRRPLLNYATKWTLLLTCTVGVASIAAKAAFVSAVSPSSSSCSGKANADGTRWFVRIPMDVAGETLCLPFRMVSRSSYDFFVPTVFTGLLVAGSAIMIRALGLPTTGNEL